MHPAPLSWQRVEECSYEGWTCRTICCRVRRVRASGLVTAHGRDITPLLPAVPAPGLLNYLANFAGQQVRVVGKWAAFVVADALYEVYLGPRVRHHIWAYTYKILAWLLADNDVLSEILALDAEQDLDDVDLSGYSPVFLLQ